MDVFYLGDPSDAELAQLPERFRVTRITRESAPDIERAEILIGALIPRELLVRAHRLRYVIIPFAGVPSRDRETLSEFPQITVLNSHFNSRAAAEHAWALLLSAAKRIVPASESLRRGDWSPRYREEYSVSLQGKTLLLIGYGAIGHALVPMARGFRMSVQAIKRTPGDDPEIDRLGTPEELARFLPDADAIIVSLPATPQTEGMLNAQVFSRMKPGVIFVNVGRGSAVDEDAFYDAMESGRIGAAGIDTWWKYPTSAEERQQTPPSRNPLDRFPHLVFSPHRASQVRERERDRFDALAEILDSIIAGAPKNIVDRSVWY